LFWRSRTRDHLVAWGVAVGAALVAVVPLVLVARGQDAQVAWLHRPGPGVPVELGLAIAGTVSMLALLVVLAVAGAVAMVRDRRRAAVVVLPWLVLPFLVSVALSQVHPVYHPRYVLFCVCAFALAAGAGLAYLTRLARPLWARIAVPAVVLAALTALSLPT